MGVLGLEGFEKHLPFALSGGMRQRVAFLRTLLTDQDVLLLDEPFGALDALTRSQMQEWLLGLWDSLGKTIVLVTHDVEEALLLSDRAYVVTARPARVKLEVAVNLPRPRTLAMSGSEEFVSLKTRLLEALLAERQEA
jgi:ABC-type nitrate/sulfonate/bicarbonate transport system ATPase subunit